MATRRIPPATTEVPGHAQAVPGSPGQGPGTIGAVATELRQALGELNRRLREQATLSDRLTWTQLRVVLRLDRDGPSTVTALARAEDMRSQSMGEVVASLRSAGWVVGAPHPTDGRQTLLSLSPTCRATVLANRAAREDWLQQGIQSRLTPDEQQQLAAALPLLRRLAERST